MTLQIDPIVIIGSGQAGVSLARELRKKCGDTPITLVTQDAGGFYSKPMLSNAFFKKMPLERLKIQDAATFAEKTNTNLKTHTLVTHIDPVNKLITTESLASFSAPSTNNDSNIETIRYEKLILAIGGSPLNPPIPGIDHTLSINHLDDYHQLRQQLDLFSAEKPVRVVIIGGGLVGCELANDLLLNGAQITLFERENQLLPRIASPLVSNQLSKSFDSIGIQCLTSSNVSSITKSNTERSVYTVNFVSELGESAKIEADIVISALGLKASTELANRAGLQTNRGIQCDRTLKTSNEHIFAIGDCVEIEELVLPYILPIMEAAKALAATLTGTPTEIKYPCMPIAVKTTAYPLVVCPPRVMNNTIRTEDITEEAGLKTLYYVDNQLVGFSLGGTATQERQALASQTLGLLDQ